jgi:hypothetical protein
MPKSRFIYDNAIDRATLSTTTTLVASMPITNLASDVKSKVCRSTTTSLAIKAVWASGESVGGVAIPFCNFSPTATMRARFSNEATATNRLLYSQTLSNAVYTKSAVTLGSTSTAPDGTSTADPVIDTVATSVHVIYQAVALTTATTYTLSMFVKAAGRTRVQLQNSTLGAFAGFDLTAGTATSSGGSGFVSSAIQSLASSWFRVSITFTTTATSSQNLAIYLQDASGNNSYLGNGTSGVYSWGWQLEISTAMSSYYPTTTVALARPVGYIDSWQSYAYDSGVILCCPATAVKLRGWTAAQSASAYAYGGGAYARHWLTTAITGVLGALIEIVDTSNLQGYAEASRLVLGAYWEPAGVNVEEGATMTVGDTSKHYRTDAGDLLTDVGTRFRKQDFNLPDLNSTDRAKMWEILWGNGMAYPVFVSLYPDNADTKLEQAHQIYGKLMQTPVMGTPYFNHNSATVEIEEI